MTEKVRGVRALVRPATEIALINEPVRRVLERMRARDVEAMPVVDGDRLVAVVSLARIEELCGPDGTLPEDLEVAAAISPGVFHCFEHVSPAEAAATMRAAAVHHLAVLDGEKELVGMLAWTDLPAEARTSQVPPAAQAEGEDDADEPHPSLRVYADKPRLGH